MNDFDTFFAWAYQANKEERSQALLRLATISEQSVAGMSRIALRRKKNLLKTLLSK